MTQSRFTVANLDKKHSFTETYKGKSVKIALAIIAALLLGCLISAGAYATNTDWHDDALSDQLTQETICERKGGVYERGICFPPTLTPSAEKYAREYVAQKQAEINRTLEQK